jgi:hypothetical protein
MVLSITRLRFLQDGSAAAAVVVVILLIVAADEYDDACRGS